MNALTGDYRSMAEACGEAARPDGYSFIPGEDFDPYDEDDVAAVLAVGEHDVHDRVSRRVRQLEAENARLRDLLGPERFDNPDWDDDTAAFHGIG
jgi:hypothetical protein